jgi:tetratricopeptide (TPR) repeat protein
MRLANRLTSRSLIAGFAIFGTLLGAMFSASRLAIADDTKPETKTSPIDDAMKHFEAGRFDEAIAAADAVGADDPLRAKAAYLLGEIHLAVGEAAKAQVSFEEANAKKANNAPILAGLGRALLAQGKAEDALDPLKKAVAADAKTARYRAWLGLALAKAGKADDGHKETSAAEKADPADIDVARSVVEERLLAQDADGAGKAAAAFAKSRKDLALAPFLVGLVLDRAGKVDDAIASYEKAITIDANFLDAHKNLAILCIAQNPMYTNQKRTKLAMEHFAEYEKRGGKDPEVLQVYSQLKSFISSQGGGK